MEDKIIETAAYRRLRGFVWSKAFERVFSLILVLNLGAIVLELQGAPLYDQTLLITTIFVCIYASEVLLLVTVKGWAWYWLSSRRRIEFIAIGLCASGSALVGLSLIETAHILAHIRL